MLDNPSRRAETIAASIIFLAAVAGFIAVPQLVAGWAFVMPGMTDNALAPSFFPRLALSFVAIAALGVVATTRSRDEVLPILTMNREDWQRVAQVVALTVGFFIGMVTIGFGVSAGLFIATAGWLLGYERRGMLLGTAIIAPVVIVLVFRYGLSVLLPGGLLF
jgi:hypothetical protein